MHPVGVEPTTFWFVVRHSIQLRYGCNTNAEDRDRTGTVITDRRILSPVRLPIPPPRHFIKVVNTYYEAEDGIRTRDPHHGKVMFYHWTTSAKCRLEDSNLRPSVYKTDALPTELSRHYLYIMPYIQLYVTALLVLWAVTGSNCRPSD